MAEQKKFRCPACGAEFETREQLEEHARKEHAQAAQPGGQQGSAPSSGSTERGQSPGSSSRTESG